jgi:hypothetical protein
MSIIHNDLFETVLFRPVKEGANRLFIVSGYATANMAVRHFEYAKTQDKEIEINLVVGMYVQDGILSSNHISFKDLQNGKGGVNFNCKYITSMPPVHSKVYSWYRGNDPIVGFIGSANYTQNAFSSSMREVLHSVDPLECKNYYDYIKSESLSCLDPRIEEFVSIYDRRKSKLIEEIPEAELELERTLEGLDMGTLTLIDKNGQVPSRSGLNWGQRTGREPNQAYINIPANIGRSGFFPDRYVVFTVITDDDKQLICVRAQDGGKGLHSTLNNSLLGEYFRNRLGLANGAFVTRADLLKYGRTDVDFYKLDDETYYLDFAVKS